MLIPVTICNNLYSEDKNAQTCLKSNDDDEMIRMMICFETCFSINRHKVDDRHPTEPHT